MFEGRGLSPRITFALLCGLSLILWVRPLRYLLALVAGDDRYTHIFLVVPIAAGLLFQQSRHHTLSVRLYRPPILLLALSLATYGFPLWLGFDARPTGVLALAIAALVLWWVAAFVFCLGTFGEFSFPLLFLLWTVPIPAIVMDQVVTVLQKGSAWAAYALFYVYRVPISMDGTALQLPGLELEVAPECSSIRSSMILLITTVLLAHLFLRARWRRWLTTLLVLPIAVAKNGVRIFVIGILAIKVDADFLTGRLHRQGGVVFLSLALAAILTTIWILRRGEGTVRT